ncbi:MAG: HAD family phosphatase [Planctomyces sp.]|nr:HAD family phosphatase [Planctomyces sp.]
MNSPQSEIRAVVFDLDGTMLNTEDVFELAGQELLARRGIQMTDAIRHSMLGRRAHEAFEALRRMTGIRDSIPDLAHETKELFEHFAGDLLTTMPGLDDVLHVVEQRQLPKAVATSSPRTYMTALLSRFELLHRFPITLTAEDVTHGKPHPEIYETVARLLNVETHQMLVLEDSETGTRSAAAAGAFVVSVPNRHTVVGDFSMSSLKVSSLADENLLRILRTGL